MNAPPALRRAPPSAVKILVPVWGKRFVRQFLEFCLPTLLAPGNIPSLAGTLPCEMVVMTSVADAPAIERDALWQQLGLLCGATIKLIDDLITDGNHSTTVTLAYARIVREAGDKLTDTCFIFLVSDYILADGSLRTVLSRVNEGASGVLAGNFQVIAEDAIASSSGWVGTDAAPLALQSRKLLKWAFGHLHPATVANIVNYQCSHNAHTNRLFWRVDKNTMIGRFYLMHVIAIRPEVMNFVIGSSWDYSFIPEMCPSGNLVVLTDSDDYLVVEIQPRDYEARNLRWGALRPQCLAGSLAEWTTADHRCNVQYTVLYHVTDVTDAVGHVEREADGFLAEVARYLTALPQPHRDHPYWLGAMAAHRAAIGQRLSPEEWGFALGDADTRHGALARYLWHARRLIYGQAPDVRPWHPRWSDYRFPLAMVGELVGAIGELLVVSESPYVYADWLSRGGRPGRSLDLSRILDMTTGELAAAGGNYAGCLLIMSQLNIRSADKLLARIVAMLPRPASVIIMVTNDGLDEATAFAASFAYHSTAFLEQSIWVARTSYVSSGPVRWALRRGLVVLAQRATNPRWYDLPYLFVIGGLLSFVNCLCDAVFSRPTYDPPRRGFCSSMLVVLRPRKPA
jgi:hypothetical protein